MSKITDQEIINYFNSRYPFSQWNVLYNLPPKINSLLDLNFTYTEAIYTHLNFTKIDFALDILVGQDTSKNIIYSSPFIFYSSNDGYSTIDTFKTVSIRLFSNHSNNNIDYINKNYLNNQLYTGVIPGTLEISLSQLFDIMRYLARISNLNSFT